MPQTQKERAFSRKVDELIKKAQNMENAEVKKTIQTLNNARKEVAAIMASTDWQAYHLPQLKAAIERAMQEFGDRYGVDLRNAQGEFWNHGVEIVDTPLREVGIYAAIPAIDTTVLSIMQNFSTDLVKGLTKDAVQKIQQEITMGMLGQKTPFEVMGGIGRNLKDKSIFRSIAARAETITRTECGRVLEAAGQARREEAAKVVPGLQKKWLHGESSKVPRITHIAANGQIRDVETPFDVGGEQLMYPRDPAGSPGNTINCGCYTVPYHADWNAAAGTDEERQAAAG